MIRLWHTETLNAAGRRSAGRGAGILGVMSVPLGIVDRSDRGKLAISGDEARAALNGVVTNEVEALEPGARACSRRC